MHKQLSIRVGADGRMRFIHDDRLAGLVRAGEGSIHRASRVEPGDPALGQEPLSWYVDLAAVGGPVLGPFGHRQQALDAEVRWLIDHDIPIPT